MEQVLYMRRKTVKGGLTANQSAILTIFWAGFLVYTVSFTLGTTQTVSIAIAELFQVLGIMLFLPAAIASFRFKLESNYLKVLYTLYCLWLITVVARGFTLDYSSIKKTLFDPYGGIFMYFVPFIMLLPLEAAHIKKTFYAIIVLCLAYLFYDVLFIKQLTVAGDENSRTMLEYFAKTLGIPAGFILMTYVYQPKKFVLIAGITVLITLGLAVIGARRGLMFMAGIILVFSFIIYSYENRHRFINVVISVAALILLAFYAGTMVYQNNSKVFNFTKERLDEDTRTVVEIYFFDDMKTKDWLIGRGMNGLVAAPVSIHDDHVGGKPGYRDGIETDYLKIILKGGMVSLGLLLLITIPAMFLGLFFSKNILSKAAALWILFWLLSLYPTNVTNFTLNYIIVWISVGICYSKSIRHLDDATLRQVLAIR